MLNALTAILLCQLAGELIVAFTGLPVPGPVCGMVLLFIGLAIHGGIPDSIATAGDGLLSHLSLLFVPAGVGVMLHAQLMARDWLAMSTALVVSTAATIVVTGGAMVLLTRWTGARRGKGADD